MENEAAKDGSSVEEAVATVIATEGTEAPLAREESEDREPKSRRSMLRAEMRKADKEPNEKPIPTPTPEPKEPTHINGKAPESPKIQAPKEDYPVAPPASMNADEKAAFQRADPKLQQFLSRREYEIRAELRRQTEQMRPHMEKYRGIDQVLTPHLDEYVRQGIQPEKIVERAIAWDKAFKKDRLRTAGEYLEAYGVDPRELISGEDGKPMYQRGSDAPRAQHTATGEVPEWYRREQQQSQQLRVVEQAESALNSFIKDKPLFRDPNTRDQIEGEMAPIVLGLLSQNPALSHGAALEKAFELVTSTPRWAPYLQPRAAADKAKEEAARAALASRSVTGGPGSSGTPTKKAANRREALGLAFDGNL